MDGWGGGGSALGGEEGRGKLEKGMRIEKHFEVYGHVFMQKMAGKRTPHPHAEELGFMT